LDFYSMTAPLIILVASVATYAFLEDIAWMLFLNVDSRGRRLAPLFPPPRPTRLVRLGKGGNK